MDDFCLTAFRISYLWETQAFVRLLLLFTADCLYLVVLTTRLSCKMYGMMVVYLDNVCLLPLEDNYYIVWLFLPVSLVLYADLVLMCMELFCGWKVRH